MNQAVRRFVPRPGLSESEDLRFWHEDVDRLTAQQRWAEVFRAKMLLATILCGEVDDESIAFGAGWLTTASAWLTARIHALQATGRRSA